MFKEAKRKAADGQMHRMYFMNRDDFSLLVMGFTGKKVLDLILILNIHDLLDLRASTTENKELIIITETMLDRKS